eukprot:10403215-Alexandrium_andersonii.AAC.1
MGIPVQVARHQAPVNQPSLSGKVREGAVHSEVLICPPETPAASGVCQDRPAIRRDDDPPMASS